VNYHYTIGIAILLLYYQVSVLVSLWLSFSLYKLL